MNDTANPSAPDKKLEEKSSSDKKEEAKVAVSNVIPGAKWYVIHIQTSYENKVKQALEQRIKSLGVEDKIFDVVVPVREVVVVKKGKKTKVTEKVFPGYVLVRMILDDDSWLVVRTTEGVTGFVGAGLKPTPISDKEVEAIMRFVAQEQPKFKAKFSVGEAVKIIEGPFADFLGTIETIDEERGKVKVLVSIFDRETPVELDFLQVAKL
jgi:transcriptional antiterminator NusG